ncbi:methyl-accepting chemotaxis protein [Ruegeria profundi]|uniref:methyl-accepting chemotaxis protein n=1 Tax=Ruegeria profundi TaxID=1685378 RepID=UPI001CD7A030|nr:methyl-accepting chemotaxis protein [Ruegeria profundi]MCA0928277.1 methyl-accepting chemotaxis protein [Ruegeria profundi]
MKMILSPKLALKLPLTIVGFCALVTVVLVTLSDLRFRDTALQNVEEHFKTLVLEREVTLQSWLEGLDADVLALAAVPSTSTALEWFSATWSTSEGDPRQALTTAYISGNPYPAGERQLLSKAEGSEVYHMHHGRFHPPFLSIVDSKGFYDVLLVSPQGDVVYSVKKEKDFTTNLLNGRFRDSGLGQVFRDAATDAPGTVHFSDLSPYEPSNNVPASFVATKVTNESGDYVGVLVIQVPIAVLDGIVNNPVGLGETGEVLLVGEDYNTRIASRFENGVKVLEKVPFSEQIEFALSGNTSFFPNATGINGDRVASYVSSIVFHNDRWALVAEQSLDEILAPVRAERNFQILVSIACALVLSVVGWLFARTITGPINSLRHTMEQVTQGDLDVEVPEATRRDDFGTIGKTLVRMRDDLREARKAEEERNQHQREQEEVVKELSIGLRRLSAGDFSQPITVPFRSDHEQLRQDFNTTMQTLNATVVEVINTSNSIRQGAAEISQASEDLSHRTESQAATLEQTAAALDEMTASVKSAAEGAKSVEVTMTESRKEAEDSGAVVQNAVAAMTEIEESASHISQIIGVIDDIAFQTNLLALNAGVEAARAGDAGRGFAVVASEVRALAQRSSEAAMEIKTLIGNSSKQVERGVDLVGKAGEALNRIVDRVGHISQMVSEIADGAAEQSTGLGEINIGVTQLDEVTQQNAAMVEESSASSHLLNSDAAKLSELVARFRVETEFDEPQSTVVEIKRPTAHGADWGPNTKVEARPIAVNGQLDGPEVWQEF